MNLTVQRYHIGTAVVKCFGIFFGNFFGQLKSVWRKNNFREGKKRFREGEMIFCARRNGEAQAWIRFTMRHTDFRFQISVCFHRLFPKLRND